MCIRILIAAFCAVAGMSFPAGAQSFGGVKIGDPATAVAGFTGPVTLGSQGADRFAKFTMPDGHELSLTTRNQGPIIYMETSRNPGVPAIAPAGPGVSFGATTRGDLRTLLGNDGFTYVSRTQVPFGIGTTYFLSYDLVNQPGVVVTFAFHLTPARYPLGADAALLDSIVVAQDWYLNEIWGPARSISTSNAAVVLNY